MSTTVKTAKIAPGYYTATVNGVRYLVRNLAGDVADCTGWVWYVDGKDAEDVFATKREALEALADWIATRPVVETKGEMMLRMKRNFDARCAAEGITVGR